jgi:hypothetical protein
MSQLLEWRERLNGAAQPIAPTDDGIDHQQKLFGSAK